MIVEMGRKVVVYKHRPATEAYLIGTSVLSPADREFFRVDTGDGIPQVGFFVNQGNRPRVEYLE
jgi:hypothetical protein